ncbi:MAG: hypothetical protein JNL56_03975 [Alphaproteobacteria bacterium]|nr:hypothetical protein [Alphaproteobacteria bacterium]
MIKYLLIGLVLGAAVMWWLGQRRKAVRDALRRDARLPPTDLVRCPRCGVHAPRGEHSCG